MVRKIPFRLAVNTMLVLLSLVMVYHLLIISSAIPYEATWGGRLKSDAQMYRFETVSIIINLMMIWVIALKGGYKKKVRAGKWLNMILWIMVVLFALNTVGNIFSANRMEAIIFTPMTLLSAILCLRMALE